MATSSGPHCHDQRPYDIDLGAAGAGDGQVDTVTVNGTDRADSVAVGAQGANVDVSGLKAETVITGADTTDRLQVNGQGGNDTVDVSRRASSLIGVSVDLGAGQR